MIKEWYYVSSGERIGPVFSQEIEQLIIGKKINSESYIWTKGFENWTKLKEIEDFFNIKMKAIEDIPSLQEIPKICYEWNELLGDEKVVMVKIGIDRNMSETEFGPYSINELKKLFNDQRINGKSLVYIPGQEDWIFLADIPIAFSIIGSGEFEITDQDRRQNKRKPFVARMFFHDTQKIYEGMCRDVSIGGMQVLVADFPGGLKEEIEMNVHPENSDFCFVAKAKIVRVLDGNQGFCIRFINLNDKASQAIMKYIENN